jgi:hypothetical protein
MTGGGDQRSESIQIAIGAGIAIEKGAPAGYSVKGVPPTIVEGLCREGFIVNPSCTV